MATRPIASASRRRARFTGGPLSRGKHRPSLSEALERRVLLSDVWPVGPEHRVNTYTTGNQSSPTIAGDLNGHYVVAWSGEGDGDNSGVFAQRFNAAGVPQGEQFRVNTHTSGSDFAASAAMDADGDFVIAWTNASPSGEQNKYARRYGVSGVPQGDQFIVNETPGVQNTASVAMDVAGNFVIAWDGPDGGAEGILAQRFSSTGTPQGGEFRVNSYTTDSQVRPSVAMDADGDFVIAWQSKQGTHDWSVRAQRFNPAGTPQGTEFRIGDSTTNDSAPSVAMDAGGNFIVAWESARANTADIVAQRFTAAGHPLGTAFRVNTETSFRKRFPVAAMSADGDFIVSWDSPGDGYLYGVYARRYDPAGTSAGDEFRVNSYTIRQQFSPTVMMESGDNFIVAWSSYGQDGSVTGAYAQRYRTVSIGQVAAVGDRVWNDLNGDGIQGANEPGFAGVTITLHNAFDAEASQTITDGAGNYHFTLPVAEPAHLRFITPHQHISTRKDQGSDDSLDSDADRVTGRSPDFTLLTPGQSESSIDAGYLLPASISGVVFNDRNGNGTRDAGEPSLPGFEVFIDLNQNGVAGPGEPLASTTPLLGSALPPSYVLRGLLPDTYVLRVVDQDRWSESSLTVTVPPSAAVNGIDLPVRTTARDTDATAAGAEFRVNTFTTDSQFDSAVAMDADGNFVVAWTSGGQDGSLGGVYARRYGAAGVPLGGEFRVNTYTVGYQGTPAIAMDGDGDFVIAWSGAGQGDDFGIFAQRFSAGGVAQGAEFRVNTLTADFQKLPSVAMDKDGDYVIAWMSSPYATANGTVYARRYNAAGVPQAAETAVSAGDAYSFSAPSVAMDHDGDLVIAWSGGGIVAQRYDAEGVPQGGAFSVSQEARGMEAAVAMDADGDFVVTWQSSYRSMFNPSFSYIYARRYNATGVSQGSEFRVDVAAPNYGIDPDVAMDADGDFVVTWSAARLASGKFGADYPLDVYCQRYNAAGVAQGAAFRVNTTTAQSQGTPAVAMDADGDFVVGWQSGPGPVTYYSTGPYDVYAQRYAVVPEVMSPSFLFESSPHRLRFNFDRDVRDSLSVEDLMVRNLTTNQIIPSSQLALLYDDDYDVATFMYLGQGSDAIGGVLPDGEYRATLVASGVVTPQGATMAADVDVEFFFLNGDANRDGRVNLQDFNVLARHFGQAGTSFAQADFTYDGRTDIEDFNILAGRFGTALAAPPAAVMGRAFGGEFAADDSEEWSDLLY